MNQNFGSSILLAWLLLGNSLEQFTKVQRGRDAIVLPPPDFREDQIQEQKGKCFPNIGYCNFNCGVAKEAPGPPQPLGCRVCSADSGHAVGAAGLLPAAGQGDSAFRPHKPTKS